METGLFFGSFNPIHIGHIAIANYIVEYSSLKELWFVISPQNPDKEQKSLLQGYHRAEMVYRAIKEFPFFRHSTIEFDMPVPSYTIDTLVRLNEKYPERKFVLIMGSDNIETIEKWKNYQIILSNYKIVVYPRLGFHKDKIISHPNVTLVDAPIMEISSSFIRKAIKEKKNVMGFMPYFAWQYLDEMNFYKK